MKKKKKKKGKKKSGRHVERGLKRKLEKTRERYALGSPGIYQKCGMRKKRIH